MSILVGRKAPDFRVPAVLPNGDIENEYQLFSPANKGKYILLFFYPLDFTFVCPSEIIAFNNRVAAFEENDVQLIGVSIDSQFTHSAWRNTPVAKGGIGPVDFPLVADINHTLCQAYGVQHPEAGVALRAAFLIDKEGIVRHQVVNDLPLGRNVDECLRVVQAWQFHEKHGEVCPAGWQEGDRGMQATADGVASYLAEKATTL